MGQIEVVRIFPHPQERVFRRYCDHAGWSQWAGVGPVRLVKEGSPDRDGVGAVRAFAFPPGLREEVTLFEPPSRLEYRISQGGFPVTGHRGEVLFTQQGAATRVTWRVSVASKIPGTSRVIEFLLEAFFRQVLTRLGRELDKQYPG